MIPIIFGLSGLALTAEEAAFFRESQPAGYILFARNIASPEQLRALTDSLRALDGREHCPILIDQEGGRVARLGPPHWRLWPSAASLASPPQGAVARVTRQYEALGLELASMGINVTCAPVLDVPTANAHDVIGDRAFGSSADSVAALGRACLTGLHLAGIEGVIKHIPGHGRAQSDSHEALPRVDASAEALEQDLAPFRALADAAMAMTAHVMYEVWDSECCASESSRIIRHQIRERIGFDGLLISDDLDMKALSGSIPERAVSVLKAGCDIALNCWGRMDDMVGIAHAVGEMSGQSRDRLDRATGHLRTVSPSVALDERIEALLACQ